MEAGEGMGVAGAEEQVEGGRRWARTGRGRTCVALKTLKEPVL